MAKHMEEEKHVKQEESKGSAMQLADTVHPTDQE